MDAWDAKTWSMTEHGEADLGHKARTKRLVKVSSDLMQQPSESLPTAIANVAQAKAAYRFLSNPEVQPRGILSGHVRATARRCMEERAVLVLQDTTTLKFHSRWAAFGLGPVSEGRDTRGFLAHTSLTVSRATHEVLGVLDQHTWVRSQKKKARTETGQERKRRTRESEHWSDNQRQVAAVLSEMAQASQSAPPHVIAVFDREGDIFEAMETLDALGHSFVIRAERNRLLETQDGSKRYSLDEVRKAPVVARKCVEVKAHAGKPAHARQPARVAVLEVRATTVTVRPPCNRKRSGESLLINVVLAEEQDAPPGTKSLCWYLITREPVATPEQALQVVTDYEARWIIEEFHMGLKTGCACEDRQMETAHALQNFLALATPMACQLLRLRDQSRRDVPVEQCNILTPTHMTVLRRLRPRMMPKVKTARQLMRVVANFGGFLNRNADPDPGWRTLWRGFERLQLAVEGYKLHKMPGNPP